MPEVPMYVLLMYGGVRPGGILQFNKFLKQEGGMPNRMIYLVSHWEEPEHEIMKFLRMVYEAQAANVLTVYDGHGEDGIFFPNGREFTYQRFASFFDIKGDLIFINNACFSGSCVDAFSEAGLLPDRSMVLASSRPTETTYRSRFLNELIKSYQLGKHYNPRQIGRVYKLIQSNGRRKRKMRISIREFNSTDPEKINEDNYEDQRQHPIKVGKSLDHLLFAR